MQALVYLAYLFGGIFLTNGVPHFVSGMTGHPFQSPFATPRGEGLSSSTVNVLWGAFNFAVAYLLLAHVGSFDIHHFGHVAAVFVPMVGFGVVMARHFGRFHGGNTPPG